MTEVVVAFGCVNVFHAVGWLGYEEWLVASGHWSANMALHFMAGIIGSGF